MLTQRDTSTTAVRSTNRPSRLPFCRLVERNGHYGSRWTKNGLDVQRNVQSRSFSRFQNKSTSVVFFSRLNLQMRSPCLVKFCGGATSKNKLVRKTETLPEQVESENQLHPKTNLICGKNWRVTGEDLDEYLVFLQHININEFNSIVRSLSFAKRICISQFVHDKRDA